MLLSSHRSASQIIRQILDEWQYRFDRIIKRSVRRPELTATQFGECSIGRIVNAALIKLARNLSGAFLHVRVVDDLDAHAVKSSQSLISICDGNIPQENLLLNHALSFALEKGRRNEPDTCRKGIVEEFPCLLAVRLAFHHPFHCHTCIYHSLWHIC
jgi:hypothetical protein